jgi:sirohydrochlorin ferrochelatase
VPWLEPDINDALELLAARGVAHVVVAPIGFLSDHMEVVWDLDTQAQATAKRLGVQMRRAATVGTHPIFVSALARLVAGLAGRPDVPSANTVDGPQREGGRGTAGAPSSPYERPWARVTYRGLPVCTNNCCPNPNAPRAAVAALGSEEL